MRVTSCDISVRTLKLLLRHDTVAVARVNLINDEMELNCKQNDKNRLL